MEQPFGPPKRNNGDLFRSGIAGVERPNPRKPADRPCTTQPASTLIHPNPPSLPDITEINPVLTSDRIGACTPTPGGVCCMPTCRDPDDGHGGFGGGSPQNMGHTPPELTSGDEGGDQCPRSSRNQSNGQCATVHRTQPGIQAGSNYAQEQHELQSPSRDPSSERVTLHNRVPQAREGLGESSLQQQEAGSASRGADSTNPDDTRKRRASTLR